MSVIATSDLAAPPVARSAPLPIELLVDIAAGLAATEDLWQPHAHHDPEHRRPSAWSSATSGRPGSSAGRRASTSTSTTDLVGGYRAWFALARSTAHVSADGRNHR